MRIIVHIILDPVFDNSILRVELNLQILRRRDLFFIMTGLQPLDDGGSEIRARRTYQELKGECGILQRVPFL